MEVASSNEPSTLVCSRCWTSFFSTPTFRELAQIQHDERIPQDGVTSSALEESVNAGCNWCQLILSCKGHPEELTLGEDHSPLTELTVLLGLIPRSIVEEEFTPKGNNRFALWINRASVYLTAFTTADDPVAHCVTARELNHCVNSPDAYSQVQKWLKECDGHEHCPKTKPYTLPSRVIEISPERDPDTPRLLATKGLVGSYAALSYCWGPKQKGVTNNSNLSSRQQRLDVSSLSRSVQDAIVVTRRLGIKYLWVDAICIIQDSDDDQVAELATMCDIYRHAQVTILAANARRSDQGFLGDRRPPSPCRKVPFWSPEGRLGTVSLRVEGWYDDGEEPANTRAWTLQEILLSPRLLIYATHTLQYQCQQHTVNLGDSINIPAGFGSWRLPSSCLDPSTEILSEVADIQSIGQIWAHIITMYSQRHLSEIKDKLTALAGIVEAFHRKIQVEYLAGLWAGDLLPRLLLWETSRTENYLPCPIYTAPSWSWASLASPVQYSGLYFEHKQEWYHVKNMAAELILRSQGLPFGGVTGGHLRFSAHVRFGLFRPPQHILWDARPGSHEENGALHSSAAASLDSGSMEETPVTCVAIVKRTYEPKADDGVEMMRAKFAFPSTSSQECAIWTAVDGLIINSVGKKDLYRRTGCFHAADEKEFADYPWQTVTLI
jgi:hypothetical protein